jgi:hypothetical protein
MTDQERRHLAQTDRHIAQCMELISRQEELIRRTAQRGRREHSAPAMGGGRPARLSSARRARRAVRTGQEATSGCYSMTSSAIIRKSRPTVRPSAFAAFRLMTSSNLVGCWTGKSAGLAPLRILSTYTAVCRARSGRFAP